MTGKIFRGIVFCILFASCSTEHIERQLTTPEGFRTYGKNKILEMKANSPFLKAHMKSGALYVLHSWNTDGQGVTISGNGTLFSSMRDTLGNGDFIIGLDSVAILETNVIETSGSAAAITVFTGITAAMTIYCITNPKACFGSCPTFYVNDGDSLRLQAEGFSSSISPSLEATDVDALYHARPGRGDFTVEMRNEALETHVVRHVDLLAIPRREGCRVFAGTDNRFWESTVQIHPFSARGSEGDCLPALLNFDNNERFSAADEAYLAAKETLNLKFRVQQGRMYGLVVASRQSLLPTYLLYQTYAYMGNDVGHWLAEVERKNLQGEGRHMEELMGGIEVAVQRADGEWQPAGEINEHGPLAVDTHLLLLPGLSDTTVDVQLRMTKGNWRLDFVSLAEISRRLQPIRIHPTSVLKDGKENHEALGRLLGSGQPLITFPGETYTLKYELPDECANSELFLESRGYYLEWVRNEWIEEENAFLLGEMFIAPERALRRLAPQFKRAEPQMEDCFWRSRYAKP